MRCLILTSLLLTLPGCTYENPLFGVSGDAPSTSEADTAATVALTDEPVTTTAEPGTTTGAMSTTSDPVASSSSSGIEPEPLCPVMINDEFSPYLLKNFEPLPLCPGPDLFIQGELAIGDPLFMSSRIECGAPNDEDVYTLGTGMALDFPNSPTCLETHLKLVDTAEGCKISQIKSFDPLDGNKLYLAAAFSAVPVGLPIQPQANNETYCGCADPNSEGPNCCAGPLDPGELVLLPTNNLNIIVKQFDHATVTLDDNSKFDFYNLQSWVGPECVNNPEAGRHIDWIAVRL